MNRAQRRRAQREARRPQSGHDTNTRTLVHSIKVLAAGLQGDPNAGDRWTREMKIEQLSQRTAIALLVLAATLAVDIATVEGSNVDDVIDQRWTVANGYAALALKAGA